MTDLEGVEDYGKWLQKCKQDIYDDMMIPTEVWESCYPTLSGSTFKGKAIIISTPKDPAPFSNDWYGNKN
jgi:hypothetical protein